MRDSVLIIAAEASSSLYAQRILEAWKAEGREVEAFGIGSRAMEKVGFDCIGRSEELAVVGLSEVVKHLPKILGVSSDLLKACEVRKPKFALLLDYPGFNLRFAKKLKALGIPVIYYISPQLWAWRTSRVKIVQTYVDRMLVLFPFEVPFYEKYGVRADFVGNPLLDELPVQDGGAAESGRPTGSRGASSSNVVRDRDFERSRFGITKSDVVLGLMPGSRHSEIEHHLATQLRAAEILAQRVPSLRVVLMVAPTLERERFGVALEASSLSVQIIKEDPIDMIPLADVMLVASGTATLMVGLLEKPMVIMYRMTALSAWFAKRLVTSTKFFGLVNLVMDRLVVPELFQDDANPQRLADELYRLVAGPEREKTLRDLAGVRAALGSRGATSRVLAILDTYLSPRTVNHSRAGETTTSANLGAKAKGERP